MMDKLKVLVVDDERVVRDGCHRVLTDKGYEVLTAENGRKAMELLAEKPVDIILLDLKMPVMSGEEVLEKTRSLYPDIPVIIVTGHGTVDSAVDCMKKGAYDFITKPFQIDQFLMTVSRADEKRLLEIRARQFQQENIKNLYDLNLEKSRLKTIINCMANGVMVTNRNLEVVLHNPALMRLLEVRDRMDNPFEVGRIIQDEGLLAILEKIQKNPSTEHAVVSQEIRAVKNILRAISAPVFGPDREVVGTVTVLEDITAFKELDEMKSDFVNMVAHELRSPLSAIRQQNSVLYEGLAGPLEDKQKELLERGIQKIDQLLGLINNLLDISKIEAGKGVQRKLPLDLEPIVREALSLMEARAKERGVELACSFQDLKPLQADADSLRELIDNLVANAINYSPEGGRVSVSARGLGEYLELIVEDTGIGIPEEEIPKIFDKFYRVKHPKTRRVMGTGLGLAIVKGIVEAHQGTISVESTPGKGTTFRILLPLISDEK
ncbi:MAG: hybrid sensor histidine kinase/response regulator [Deltaproteobacteria bacterium]|nr:hybrid sensor histidine kinase/response regulator [Deltaproteobacteria bacterium]